jgi:tetratricopeptide (TPR) repeat protein
MNRLVGRAAQLAVLAGVVDSAIAGAGELVCIVGRLGAGKTALLAALIAMARERGVEVLVTSVPPGQAGRGAWVQLLADARAAPASLAVVDSGEDPIATSAALGELVTTTPRLVVVDDLDRGGPDAFEALELLSTRLVGGSTAVVVTSSRPVGLGRQLDVTGLTAEDLAAALPGVDPAHHHPLWVASRGLPGAARELAGALQDLPAGRDPLVHLGLAAVGRSEFLAVDDDLVRLIERALSRATDDATRARLLARLARELLGDPLAGARRRALADEALRLARAAADAQSLAEVLDARLHALWDPGGAVDRLEAASEIVQLSHEAGDSALELSGTFWRFIALMELGRVAEAELVLGAYQRIATALGDAEAQLIALSRHAVLANLRGRFDVSAALTDEVAAMAVRIRLPDAERLVGSLRSPVVIERGTEPEWAAAEVTLAELARALPGHLYDATRARILLALGRREEAAAELDRLLPWVLASSGPRWLGAVSQLAGVAAATADGASVQALHRALSPYVDRLIVYGGANATSGFVAYHLGVLELRLGHLDEAVAHLEQASGRARQVGALPDLAHSLAVLADALDQRGADGDRERATTARAKAADIGSNLGLRTLLRSMSAAGGEWSYLRDGTDWVLVAGAERARLPDSRGAQQLRSLLATPRHDVSALDLVAGGAGLAAAVAAPVLDGQALAAYRRRLLELETELQDADETGDAGRSERAEAERLAILAELRRATSLGGRSRAISAEAERARVNVTRTLRAVLQRIGAQAPQAAAHLRTSIRTGLSCRYDPAPGGPTGWRV